MDLIEFFNKQTFSDGEICYIEISDKDIGTFKKPIKFFKQQVKDTWEGRYLTYHEGNLEGIIHSIGTKSMDLEYGEKFMVNLVDINTTHLHVAESLFTCEEAHPKTDPLKLTFVRGIDIMESLTKIKDVEIIV